MKQIIKKDIFKDCGCTHELPNKKVKKDPNCKSCNGTGILEDGIYYHIVNGICIDGDSLK